MKPDQPNSLKTILANHLSLIAILLIAAGGLYLFLGNTATIVVSVVVLLLAHLAIVSGAILLFRGRLAKTIKHLWQALTN